MKKLKKFLALCLMLMLVPAPASLANTNEPSAVVQQDNKPLTDNKQDPETNANHPENGATCPQCPFAENSGLNQFLKSDENFIRLSGKDRYDTSTHVSAFLRQKSKKIILADGRRYYDALSGGVLSEGRYPIILVDGRLSTSQKQEIKRLGVEEAVILGGTSSVDAATEHDLTQLGIQRTKIKRIAGSDRYATSLAIAEQAQLQNLVFASGENFPDALAAGPFAYSNNAAVVLLGSTWRQDYGNIVDKSTSFYTIGGMSSVNPSLIPKKTRVISGNNRYATAVHVADYMNAQTVILASGTSFPDALSISPVALGMEAPILLSEKDTLSAETAQYLLTHREQIKKVIMIGGQGSLSDEVEKQVKEILKTGNWPKEPEKPEPSVDLSVFNAPYVMSLRDTKLSDRITVPAGKVLKVISKSQAGIELSYNGQVGEARPQDFGKNTIQKNDIPVPYISQLYPVYAPVGCEPTALLMGLKGKGYAKNVGLRTFLDQMPKHSSNPKKGFVGSPYQPSESLRTTIDPAPLARYAAQYGPVVDYTGKSMDDIIMELDNGHPVLIYVTLHWKPAYYRNFNIEGKTVSILRNNHGLLLTGYDKTTKMFSIADPYNHESCGANRRKPFFYKKARSVVEPLYNIRHFAVVVR